MSFSYTTTLPFRDHTVFRIAALLRLERERLGTREDTRSLTPLEQAVMFLAYLGNGDRASQLFADHGVSRSVGYRALEETEDVLAAQAPDLRVALARARREGYGHVIIDGTIIETDRVSTPGPTEGVDLYWSGKIHNHGGNEQVLSSPDDGFPLWVSDVRPGREHDTTALRAARVLKILEEWWTFDLHEVLLDGGYEGLGCVEGPLRIPYKKPRGGELTPEQKAHNRVHYALRAVGERANALFKITFRLLRNVTRTPRRIGPLMKAALVVLQIEHRRTA
jgi:hypothetical protein